MGKTKIRRSTAIDEISGKVPFVKKTKENPKRIAFDGIIIPGKAEIKTANVTGKTFEVIQCQIIPTSIGNIIKNTKKNLKDKNAPNKDFYNYIDSLIDEDEGGIRVPFQDKSSQKYFAKREEYEDKGWEKYERTVDDQIIYDVEEIQPHTILKDYHCYNASTIGESEKMGTGIFFGTIFNFFGLNTEKRKGLFYLQFGKFTPKGEMPLIYNHNLSEEDKKIEEEEINEKMKKNNDVNGIFNTLEQFSEKTFKNLPTEKSFIENTSNKEKKLYFFTINSENCSSEMKSCLFLNIKKSFNPKEEVNLYKKEIRNIPKIIDDYTIENENDVDVEYVDDDNDEIILKYGSFVNVRYPKDGDDENNKKLEINKKDLINGINEKNRNALIFKAEIKILLIKKVENKETKKKERKLLAFDGIIDGDKIKSMKDIFLTQNIELYETLFMFNPIKIHIVCEKRYNAEFIEEGEGKEEKIKTSNITVKYATGEIYPYLMNYGLNVDSDFVWEALSILNAINVIVEANDEKIKSHINDKNDLCLILSKKEESETFNEKIIECVENRSLTIKNVIKNSTPEKDSIKLLNECKSFVHSNGNQYKILLGIKDAPSFNKEDKTIKDIVKNLNLDQLLYFNKKIIDGEADKLDDDINEDWIKYAIKRYIRIHFNCMLGKVREDASKNHTKQHIKNMMNLLEKINKENYDQLKKKYEKSPKNQLFNEKLDDNAFKSYWVNLMFGFYQVKVAQNNLKRKNDDVVEEVKNKKQKTDDKNDVKSKITKKNTKKNKNK